LIIEKNKLSKKDFIYIGDTKFDIICAKNAGVKFILAGWGYGDAIEESVVANNVDDFIRFIERNL
jgi:phosphoglycolate phosphatase-like HAD superfamily hydrolase